MKKDVDLSKSVKRILLGGQNQVLRYCRWNNNARLVMSSNFNTNTNIPNCQYCNGPRKFEFQVMPQLLYYLNVDKDTKVSYQAQLASKIGIYILLFDIIIITIITKVRLQMPRLHQKYLKIIN